MSDTDDALARNEPSSALLNAISDGLTPITCDWLAALGYPFQYQVDEGHLHRVGYRYDIQYDHWVINGR